MKGNLSFIVENGQVTLKIQSETGLVSFHMDRAEIHSLAAALLSALQELPLPPEKAAVFVRPALMTVRNPKCELVRTDTGDVVLGLASDSGPSFLYTFQSDDAEWLASSINQLLDGQPPRSS